METHKRSARHRSGDEESKKSASSFFQGELFRQWILPILITVLAVVVVRVFILDLIFVDGASMNDTLETRDLMVVTKIERLFTGPVRGEVVVCKYPEQTGLFVKRIVAIGGDSVMIRSGTTYVNNEEVDEPYVTHPSNDNFGPFEVPEGHIMVMGDNRINSLDSRSSNVGPLPVSSIVGYARAVLLPFSKFGWID